MVTGSISSTTGADGLPAHAYRIAVLNAAKPAHVLAGEVAKGASGHRNPLHLLAAVAKDIDLATLGSEYAATRLDLASDDPRRLNDRRRRIDDVATGAIDAIRTLAAAGGYGAEALRRIEAAMADARAGRLAPPNGLVTEPDIIDAIADGYATGADVAGRRW
ncbi:hypothetical protein CRT60_00920 [Azospirillum palustre]|uniref:Uncharacterized protein n=1 Tax=Azospirillum palustre TaxID=2044885 RepID=A0A2B8BPR5_9PROT|nr:hypothetical protein CRT60_00920 [Azospirillum palustre]